MKHAGLEHAHLLWRHFQPRRRLYCGQISLIPLLNVALLVALFVATQSTCVLQPGVIVQLPVAGFVSGASYGSLVVTVTQEGLAFFNDELTNIDELGQAFHRAAGNQKDLSLVIEADFRVPYGLIVRIMNLAAAAGIQQVNLATRPSFGEEIMP